MKRKQFDGIWKRRKQLVVVLVTALACGWLPVSGNAPFSRAESAGAGIEESHGLHNPVTDSEGITTWDCVYFGNYWQNDTNGDGVADKNDEKEPIRWRVLSVNGDDAFLLADKNLDAQKYNDTYDDVTWETCTMRSWLNGYGTEANACGNDYASDNFLQYAFTDSEQTAILETRVVNEDNSKYGTEGGSDTADKVFLLSIDEVRNPAYGFRRTLGDTDTRMAANTQWRWMSNIDAAGYGPGYTWWLRSPGLNNKSASTVYGCVRQGGENVTEFRSNAVRPALHLNLLSASDWSYAGSIASDKAGIRVETPAPGAVTNQEPHNPIIDDDGSVMWDCVYFGNYWQNDTNGDGVADKNDEKEPIKWRVLSVDDNDAFLLADKNLDVQKYNDTDADVTWEICTMRRWLNGSFLESAFNDANQAAIRDTVVINKDNLEYGTGGGKDTIDKVFLLSIDEVTNQVYGFERTEESSITRKAFNTAYVEAGGELGTEDMDGMGNGDNWWLRSPGISSNCVSYVWYDGYEGYKIRDAGTYVNVAFNAVRPVLHLNLSFTSEWAYAGTVTILGDKPDAPSPSPEVTALPSPLPEQTGKPTPSGIPTKEPGKPSASPSLSPEEIALPTPSALSTNTPLQTEKPETTEKPSASPSFSPEETEKPTPSVTPTNTPLQTEKPETTEKPSAMPSQTPGTQQGTVNPVPTPGLQTEVPVQTAPPAVQKTGKVTGLKLKAVKKGIQASWKKSKGAAGYEVWSSTSKKFAGKKARTVKAAKVTIKNLKKKKIYYVKVRAYVMQNGKKVYGAWSSTKKKRVK